MSETPETDAFFWRKDIDWNKEVEFCCKLERERNEWKEVAEGSLLGAIKERDEAVSSCQICQQWHSKIVADRDYWRAEAERWQEVAK